MIKRTTKLPIRQQSSTARSILSRSPSTVHPSPPTNSEKLDRQHPGQTPPRARSFFHSTWSPNSATVAPAQDVAARTPLPPSRPLPRVGLPISPKKITKAINSTFDRRSSPVHPAPSPQPPRSPSAAGLAPSPPERDQSEPTGDQSPGQTKTQNPTSPPHIHPTPANWATMSRKQRLNWSRQGGRKKKKKKTNESKRPSSPS